MIGKRKSLSEKNVPRSKENIIRQALLEYRTVQGKIRAEHGDSFQKIQSVVQRAEQMKGIRQKIVDVQEENTTLQRKNMDTISKFLEIRGESDEIQSRLKGMLLGIRRNLH